MQIDLKTSLWEGEEVSLMINKQLIIGIILMFPFSFVYGEEFYVYSNIDSTNISIILSESRTEIMMGHIGIEAKACNYGKVSLCIESDRLLFTLPEKGAQIINSEWTSERVQQDNYNILGRKISLEKIILTKNTGDVFTYWYSEKNGILFIKIEVDELAAFFILRGECGYGAIESCNG